jgi:hypothetical protein
VQRYALFFNLQIFSQKFSIFYFQRQSFQELLTLAGHPFFKWECKGSAFFFTSKSFCEKIHFFRQNRAFSPQNRLKMAITGTPEATILVF